ncbi:E3 ubiquitin-protein ligase TRIM39-like isoform X2 [Synchiropus splendidus]|uniref:E3 ubiquitin-protein ligase TRIM39-like isoform X2 n=1 Tax=Synchiropus splendidus TaxID=270530 RepID=UPI00237E44B5|nr:E3 ubiquitin-protein ligase TRIM39-like isoform X2 [Synchiropus splendidus]
MHLQCGHFPMAAALSEEQFRCAICQDIFTDPVSIPCGHNYCFECIKRFWDTKNNKCWCPLCKEAFKSRPDLRINVDLKDITDKFKRSLRKPTPTKRVIPRQHSKEVFCDMCNDTKQTAIKSCLDCKLSFCEEHLVLHQKDLVTSTHWLTDLVSFDSSHLCRHHNKVLELFCKTDQTPLCVKCSEHKHRHHEFIPLEKEIKKIKGQMKKTEAEFQQLIQQRVGKIEEIKQAVELSKIFKEQEVQTGVEAISRVISDIELIQNMLIEEIQLKQDAAETNAQGLLNELDQEISVLERRRGGLQKLERTNSPLHLLQSYPSLSIPPLMEDWTKVHFQSDNHIGAVRRAMSKLVDVCQEIEKKLLAEEINKTQNYAEDMTLDPSTAAGWLVLSTDGKKVSVNTHSRRMSIPDDPRRFDSCVSILCRQSFTSGKHYWIVQVGDKTDWDLGVARESINRKGAITVRPDCGYWAICRRKGGSLSACAGPSVPLQLQETPHKVGVFLDIEEGIVSFYNTEAKTHIYTYTGCGFFEPIYPYLNPCLHDNGKNTAPLIICPVEDTEMAGF